MGFFKRILMSMPSEGIRKHVLLFQVLLSTKVGRSAIPAI